MNANEIDKYLFDEMPETQREQFEDAFVGDDALFYEIAERENELVDLYARDMLSDSERQRFEKNLATLPARRQKIANAKVLREFVAEERVEHKAITIAKRKDFFSQLFSFGPALQFASVAAIVVLGLASIVLWTENSRLGSLQQELAASRQREIDLAARVDEERGTSSDLTTDLDAERERIVKLESEIANLRKGAVRPPVNNPPPTIATLILSSIGIRNGSTVPVRRLELSPAVTSVSMVIAIPSDAGDTEIVSVTLNDERVAQNLKTRIRGGEKSVSITLPATKLRSGRNEINVLDGKNAIAATYIVVATRAL